MVTVNVTNSSRTATNLSTDFRTSRSATCAAAFRVTEDVLLALMGSVSGVLLTVAVLTIAPVVVVLTVATIVRMAISPTAIFPIVHWLVPVLYDPCVALVCTKVIPAGTVSTTRTFVAGLGPLLRTVTEKVTCCPAVGKSVFAVFATVRSAALLALMVADELLFAALLSVSFRVTLILFVKAPV